MTQEQIERRRKLYKNGCFVSGSKSDSIFELGKVITEIISGLTLFDEETGEIKVANLEEVANAVAEDYRFRRYAANIVFRLEKQWLMDECDREHGERLAQLYKNYTARTGDYPPEEALWKTN